MSGLQGKDRRALRALGHHLKPVVQVGQHGITDALVEATERALADHELIKVKVLESAPEDRRETAAALAERTGSELAQVLGRTFLLFKPNLEKGSIELPRTPVQRAPKDEAGAPAGTVRAGARGGAKGAVAKGTSAKGAAGKRPAGEGEAREPKTFDARASARLPPRRHGR